MRKLILILVMLRAAEAFAQNGTTIVYNTSDVNPVWSNYKFGMITSASVAMIGCLFLTGSVRTTFPTAKDEDAYKTAQKTGYIMLTAGFAGIIITNLTASKKVA